MTKQLLALLAVVSLLSNARADTAVDEVASAVCRERTAPTRLTGSPLEFETLLLDAPKQALADACARQRAGNDSRGSDEARLRAALDLARALPLVDPAKASPAPVDALIDALLAAPALRERPDWRAQALLARLSQAAGNDESSRVVEQGQVLRKLLGDSGQGESLAMVQTLSMEAIARWRLQREGDLAQADAGLDEASRILAKLGLTGSGWQGLVFNARSMLAFARTDLEAATRWAEREIELARARGRLDDPGLIDTYISLGTFHSQRYHYDAAEQAYRQGLALEARHPDADPYSRAGLHSNYAVLLFGRGRLEEAAAEAGRADAIARQAWGDASPRRVQYLIVQGESRWRQGRLREALAQLDTARRLATAAPKDVGPVRLMRLHEGRATVLLLLGQAEAADRALDEGFAVDASQAPNLSYWRARALWLRAKIQLREGRGAAAEAGLAEAEPVLARQVEADNPWIQTLIGLRCRAQLKTSLIERAGDACERLAQAPIRATEGPFHRALRLASLATAAAARGDGGRERERGLRLAALAAALHTEGPDPLWSAYAELALALRQGGQHRPAVLLGKLAVNALQALRQNAQAEALRLEDGFLADKRIVYERLADWLTEDRRLAEALAVLPLLKEQEFHDFTRGAAETLRSTRRPALLPFTPDEQRALALWQAAPDAERQPPRSMRPINPAALGTQEALQRRLLTLEAARVAQWQAWLARPEAAPAKPALRSAAPAPEPLRQRPPAGSLLVHAYSGDVHLNLVIDSPRGRELLRQPLDGAALDRAIGRLLGALARRAEPPGDARELSAQIAGALRQAALRSGARRLVLRASGPLRYLPWAALDDGRGPLGELLAIEQALPGSERPAPASRGGQPAVTVLAVTQALADQPALPALAQEVCAIVDGEMQGWARQDPPCAARGALPGRAWLNAAFTRGRLEASALAAPAPRAATLLHLGSHFVLKPGLMNASWLLLGDGSRLPLDDIARLDFSGQSLVTLSACETGLGGAGGLGGARGDGAEIDGLNQVIMRRGATRVLASLWRVEDRSTAALMQHFYAALARGLAPAEALQRAQQHVRAQAAWRHPFHWAGFYLASAMP